MKQLLQVALRYQAAYVPNAAVMTAKHAITPDTASLAANLSRLGLGISEPLLHALQQTDQAFHQQLFETLKEITGANHNWAPLVKGWDMPTGENAVDHIVTAFVNFIGAREVPGVLLSCGHLIPDGTFPVARYNGCPFCGTPFEVAGISLAGEGSQPKILELWTDKHLSATLKSLLTSRTALDATQQESLRTLLAHLPLPQADIAMKETLMLVIDAYVAAGEEDKAQTLFRTPVDVMRYLWFKQTGKAQIMQPKVLTARHKRNGGHMWAPADRKQQLEAEARAALRLKYSRSECLRVAKWMNGLSMDIAQMCEAMHPKRAMWVRFIRALRLIEYGKRAQFGRLGALMDMFGKEQYEVWQGQVDALRSGQDSAATFDLLKQRPGMFARSLFANMLWFNSDDALKAFGEIASKVPARLLVTLAMYADQYFSTSPRVVKPLGGVNKQVGPNQFISKYTDEQLTRMKDAVADMCLAEMGRRYATEPNKSRTVYIDPALFKMPLAIGDRAETVQDLPAALMGTRFAVEGNALRLFMHWGAGLPAQHMDMDLTAVVAYDDKIETCSYYQLVTTGCNHSGDIRSIPEQVGTAEYIELNIDALHTAGAQYVVFTSNAYSAGALTPNVVVGWMNSAHPMKISETTGVAYDPSCVQHQVRVTSDLTKGLVFGMLDVQAREVVWLELQFGGQLGRNIDLNMVKTMLRRLEGKMSIGALLTVKAQSQQLSAAAEAVADEVYNLAWARDAAAVTQLMID
ncbi:hypothetical protein MKQ68_20010 [Chitinophaga horti]|uniref:Uncharacterized protein n=1 Tax=Chitinophaga horti TaxID=2920382 RepID=A0ABY6IYA1_9BACT|nr:hypothetical protein [Chitinophaga horti]UYQ92373.1 hypothetical protein MKQ68_20010 [Chitinophaga horti]